MALYQIKAPTKIVIAYDNLSDSVDELAQTVGMPGLSISTSRASATLKASVKSPQNNLSGTRNKAAAAAAAAASLILRGGANKPEHDAAYRKMFNPSKSMNSIAFLTYQTDRAHQTHRARVSRGLTNRFDTLRARKPNQSASASQKGPSESDTRKRSRSGTRGRERRGSRNWRPCIAAPKMSAHKLRQFEVLGVLGKGAFAQCHLVKRKSDGVLFALKKYNMPMNVLSASEREEAVTEVRVLANLVHDNILQYEDSFLEDGAMHIVMQYADDGTVDKITNAYKLTGRKIPENTIWALLIQLLRALKYCHGLNVMHRDIKPQNVMLTTNKKFKVPGVPVDFEKSKVLLGDFGIAKILAKNNAKINEQCGTPYYYSPEICKGKKYGQKSDIWAVGVMLFELMALKRPFMGDNMFAVMHAIINNKRPPIPTDGYSADLTKVCETLLQIDPIDRCFAFELLEWPAVKKQAARFDRMRSKLVGAVSPQALAKDVKEKLKRIQRQAATFRDEDREEWMEKIEKIEEQVARNPHLQIADVYNKLGGVMAEIGSFERAIAIYMKSAALSSSTDPKEREGSYYAKEQAANLLVRTAHTKWHHDQTNGCEIVKKEVEEKIRRGLALLEEVCQVKESGERRALLGSAYKRWFSIGDCTDKKVLSQAVQSYYRAAALQEAQKKNGCYAMLNALTLQMLAGDRYLDDLLGAGRSLYTKTLLMQEAAPADHWLWVQVADALCLRYLLLDSTVSKQMLEDCYTKTLVFGSSERVKKSVEDQLAFMARALSKRLQTAKSVDSKLDVKLDVQHKRACGVHKFVQCFRLQGTDSPRPAKPAATTPTTSAAKAEAKSADDVEDVTDDVTDVKDATVDTDKVTDVKDATVDTDKVTAGATDATAGATDATAGATDVTDVVTDVTDVTDGVTDATAGVTNLADATDVTDAADGVADVTDATDDVTDVMDAADGVTNVVTVIANATDDVTNSTDDVSDDMTHVKDAHKGDTSHAPDASTDCPEEEPEQIPVASPSNKNTVKSKACVVM